MNGIMEPLIPVNVNEEMLSDASVADLNLIGPVPQYENSHSTLTHDEAVVLASRLSDENRQLKGNLQQANLAMKNAYDMMTKLREADEKKEKEIDLRCKQAKEKIETQRQAIADRDKTIEELRTVQTSASDGQLTSALAQANRSVSQHRQKIDQLNQELAVEKTLKAKLLSQQETSVRQAANWKEELKAAQLKLQQLSKYSDDRRTDNTHLVENLKSHVHTLDKSLKIEKEKSGVLQEQFSQLQVKHEQLLSDYHDLLDETKADKLGDVAALKRDYDQRLDNLTAQLVESEDVLGSKDSQIQTLQQRVKDYDVLKKQLTQQKEEIEALQAQASVYKVDFEAERKSREELNDERLQLQEKLIAAEEELQVLKVANQIPQQLNYGYAAARRSGGIAQETPMGEVYPQRLIAQEHSANQGAAAAVPVGALPIAAAASVEALPANRTTETTVFIDAELKCPMCNHVAPDIDSLQLHCNDCIE